MFLNKINIGNYTWALVFFQNPPTNATTKRNTKTLTKYLKQGILKLNIDLRKT